MTPHPGTAIADQLHDASVVLSVHTQIREAAALLARNPLDAVAGAKMRALLQGPLIAAAGQALDRLLPTAPDPRGIEAAELGFEWPSDENAVAVIEQAWQEMQERAGRTTKDER